MDFEESVSRLRQEKQALIDTLEMEIRRGGSGSAVQIQRITAFHDLENIEDHVDQLNKVRVALLDYRKGAKHGTNKELLDNHFKKVRRDSDYAILARAMGSHTDFRCKPMSELRELAKAFNLDPNQFEDPRIMIAALYRLVLTDGASKRQRTPSPSRQPRGPKAAVDSFLSLFDVIETPYDGDCLYGALRQAYATLGINKTIGSLRQVVSDHIINSNPRDTDYQLWRDSFFEDQSETALRCRKGIKKGRENEQMLIANAIATKKDCWADYMALIALSKRFNIIFVQVIPPGVDVSPGLFEVAHSSLTNNPNVRRLALLYSDNAHYELLSPRWQKSAFYKALP